MVQKLATLAEKAFQPCAPERAFRFSNGAAAHTLAEFRDHLQGADLGTLQYHRNHYHHWIHDVLGDKTLATRVKMLGERRELHGDAYKEQIVDTVEERLAVLERELGPKRSRSASSGKAKTARDVPVRRRSN